ncbi:N-acetylneuraminate synthase family protein [Cyanobium sp. NIES-981]|uniref:N-acetylneuraminate synthase family protein n=1 Tax=Cyanobium sp. NIES-981 TaxID=1851505 RepID=UPI0007DE1E97|nr:N-acetylneuraminate synthase family protein [Cyanobium sp. NIES-981]SBO44574.1 putative N-acetylneuraminic acid synthetase [Cyanobium sp. NIES-981]
MQIERNFTQFVVFAEDTVLTALSKITANKSRLIFVVSESGILQGVLSDGDFRRWVADCSSIDLNAPVTRAMNPRCRTGLIGMSPAELLPLFSPQIQLIPLLDSHGRIAAVAMEGARELRIAGRVIGEGSSSFLIAEIGNNHNGSLDLALQLIDAAAAAGVDCAKFQMREMKNLYVNSGDSNDMSSDLGTQYTLDLLERFQLSDDDLYRCFDYTAQKGMIPLCTPWDLSSLEKLNRWGMEAFKVASADFTNHALLSAIAATGKPLICSTGMATELEISSGIRHLRKLGAPFALLHCNSTYPTPYKDVNLRYLARLRELSDAPVGYSGHERGIEVPIAAVALGATVVEKHITLDPSMEGNDHKVSLLPSDFARMVEAIRAVEESMGSDAERAISQGELMNREILAKSLVAACSIPRGTRIEPSMVRVQSPGQGLQPYRLQDLLGQTLNCDKKPGDFFFESDLGDGSVKARNYHFFNPFGVPVRYHDLALFSKSSNLDLVEIHLSYKDLDIPLDKAVPEPVPLGLVVHAPELFSGDHTLDLCSLDEDYRNHSIRELQRVITIARLLKDRFECPEDVLLVTNVGGFSAHQHLCPDDRRPMLEALVDSLGKLTSEGVEIIPQTMPPFPWHFGGQRFHNLFVDPDFIESFCQQYGYRVCLDVSHSKLACNHLGQSFHRFLERILPLTAHLHLADARGVDGEGLQVNDGDIDWPLLFRMLRDHAPKASFIPEIWQGHKNQGEGAWLALERLELHDQPESASGSDRLAERDPAESDLSQSVLR